MVEALAISLAALFLVAVAVVAVTLFRARWPMPRHGPVRLARPVFTLADVLHPGDLVTVRQKWPRQRPRRTAFAEWSADGRMILRTSPLGSPFRRPTGDLVERLSAVA